VTRPAEAGIVLVSVVALCAAAALAQTKPDAFTATASVKNGSVRATADARVEVHSYATDDQRAALTKAAREGGTGAVQKILATMADAGYIQLGDRRTPIKYAGRREMPDGQLVTVITAAPILFLGAGLPAAKPTAGFDIAVAILDIKNSESGTGELAPAAKIGVDDKGALLIQDYGATVMWLNGLVRAK
jgi:hypothetical protein